MLTPVELLRHYVVKGKHVSVDSQVEMYQSPKIRLESVMSHQNVLVNSNQRIHHYCQGFVRFVGSNIAYPKNTKTNIVATSQNPNSNERE